MKQLSYWDEEVPEETIRKAQNIFKPYAIRKKRMYQLLNCLFWSLAIIILMIICLVVLVYVNSVY